MRVSWLPIDERYVLELTDGEAVVLIQHLRHAADRYHDLALHAPKLASQFDHQAAQAESLAAQIENTEV